MTIVLHRHCREIGFCNRGMRELCSRENIDWAAFVRHGIPAERLRAMNNAMADLAIARAERDDHGQ